MQEQERKELKALAEKDKDKNENLEEKFINQIKVSQDEQNDPQFMSDMQKAIELSEMEEEEMKVFL